MWSSRWRCVNISASNSLSLCPCDLACCVVCLTRLKYVVRYVSGDGLTHRPLFFGAWRLLIVSAYAVLPSHAYVPSTNLVSFCQILGDFARFQRDCDPSVLIDSISTGLIGLWLEHGHTPVMCVGMSKICCIPWQLVVPFWALVVSNGGPRDSK